MEIEFDLKHLNLSNLKVQIYKKKSHDEKKYDYINGRNKRGEKKWAKYSRRISETKKEPKSNDGQVVRRNKRSGQKKRGLSMKERIKKKKIDRERYKKVSPIKKNLFLYFNRK